MAQPQQQSYVMAQPPTLSPQASPSLGPQQQPAYPNKKVKLNPQEGSASYNQSPYTMSPSTSAPHSASASPHFPTAQLPQQVYNTPYTNGGPATPNLTLPQSQPPNHFNTPSGSPLSFPAQNPLNTQPIYNNYMMPTPQNTGTMGPPSKPLEKPKEEEHNLDDVLGGTGIDLREEEQYTFQMYNNSFNSQLSGSQSGTISSGHSFSQFPPGDEGSFYGAGPANATAEKDKLKLTQEEYHMKVAEKAWNDAAHDLAISRQRELRDPFLVVGNLHRKMERISRENGLSLNTESNKTMGTMKLPDAFPSPSIRIQSAVGPNGTFTTTEGTFIPPDSLLVDQLALISISTKHRLRALLEDAARLARGRQSGSQGVVPTVWEDVAVQSNSENANHVTDGGPRSGWESAVSPRSTPLKRSHSAANEIPTPISQDAKTPSQPSQMKNGAVASLRDSGRKEREYEESRLRKRIARSSGETTSRQGSLMPSTPGSIAPESIEKAPTKKELKKKAEAKTSEAASHAAANVTTAQFLGGGGNIFGKKGKKTYSWMTGGGGGSGSGTSTPSRLMTQGLQGTPANAVSTGPERLTSDGARRLGTWREDKEKGRGIQIRDWVTVLEGDGREKKALQLAYTSLDSSEPK